MSRKQSTFALSLLLFAGLILTLLFLLQWHGNRADAQVPVPTGEPDPFALIKTIVVNGAERDRADPPLVTLERAGRQDGAAPGTMLYVGDELTTGPGVKLTILFLDNPAEKDNEVQVDENTHVQLGSIFTWSGRILASVKGYFETKTTRARWSVQGTEYELVVEPNGTNRLVVLKGAVRAEPGPNRPTVAALVGQESDAPTVFIPAVFREPARPLPQAPMEIVAVSGRVINIDREFILSNSCRRRHVYQVKNPVGLDWFQFLGADQFPIDGRGTRKITFAIRLDATRLPVGNQDSQIAFPCLDCSAEPGCAIGGLLLPITVKVIPNPVPTPTPTPTPTTTGSPNVAARMEELVLLPAGPLQKLRASLSEVDQALNWSNQVIIPGEPTYSAPSVAPRFATEEERNRVFREARRSSIVNNDQASREMLADVYVDWGKGAKAEQELQRVGLSPPETPERLTTLGEAYRLMGDLRTAEQLLLRATRLIPTTAAAWNALGNVYLDQAKVAQDKDQAGPARGFLARAESAYNRALQLPPTPPPDDWHHAQTGAGARAGKTQTVAQSNIGEVHLRLGEIARKQGRREVALNEYQRAEQAFGDATQSDPDYQFANTGLGDVYRETGETLMAGGDRNGAAGYFSRARDQYDQALRRHSDMAEAYVGIGQVLDDTGKPREALKYYTRATEVRPELPDPHYHLAVALYPYDQARAAEQARAYLRIEREPLTHGLKADDAQEVKSHRPPKPKPRPDPYPSPAPPTPTPTPTDTPTQTVKVPGLKGDRRDDAVRELRQKGFAVREVKVADCEASNKVLYTEPAKDQRVSAGTLVNVYISTAGPNAVRVPDLRHRPGRDAEATLQRLGLTVTYKRPEMTDAEPEGHVYRQNPSTGLMMPRCPVALTLARPIPLVVVDNYFLSTERDATIALTVAGLTLGNVSEREDCERDRRVVDQNPQAGTSVRRGSSVSLVIATCSLVDVPDLTGQTFDQAAQTLKSRGLGIQFMGGDKAGTVEKQNPTAGPRKAHRRDVIQLWFWTVIG